MKKIYLLILALILLPAFASAVELDKSSYSYKVPLGEEDIFISACESGVSQLYFFNVGTDSFIGNLTCWEPFPMSLIEGFEEEISLFVSGNYSVIDYIGMEACGQIGYSECKELEGFQNEFLFSVGSKPILTISSGFASSSLAFAGRLWNDLGTMFSAILGLLIGFYVITQVIWFFATKK